MSPPCTLMFGSPEKPDHEPACSVVEQYSATRPPPPPGRMLSLASPPCALMLPVDAPCSTRVTIHTLPPAPPP